MADARRWRMFASYYEGTQLPYRNFGDQWYVEMHGAPAMVEVELIEDPDGDCWGWMGFAYLHYKADVQPVMVQPNRGLFNMQFAYGPDAEVERGHGEIVRLRVEVIQSLDDVRAAERAADAAHEQRRNT